MPAESENFEVKSEYAGSSKERLRIIKTIICMANVCGGKISIRRVTGGARALDSASLTSAVNKYIDPPLVGIESNETDEGGFQILVPESDRKPHITKANGTYRENDETKYSFYKGQIWIRHSSSNDHATPDDLRSMIFGAAGKLLEVIGAKLQMPGFALDPSDPAAIPAKLVDSPSALHIQTDFVTAYPHTRRSLGDEFGKANNWITLAMPRLGLEDGPNYAYTDRNSAGHATHWRYSDVAREALQRKLESEPDWDPRDRPARPDVA